MNCEEFVASADAFVLGALEPDEHAACEAHLRQGEPHDGCHEAVARATRLSGRLASALPAVAPGEGVWRNIENALAPAPTAPAPAPVARLPRRARAREGIAWALAAAAAVALFMVNGARERAEQRAVEASRTAVEQRTAIARMERERALASIERDAVAMIARPGTRVLTMQPQGGRDVRATAVVDLANRRAIVLGSTLPDRADRDLQLWVIRGSAAPIPAGFLRRTHAGTAVGEIDPAILAQGAPDALAVSLEPSGGRPTPTEVLLVGPLAG